MATTPISWISQGFRPNSIAGLIAWFDMQDSSSYTNTSGAISAITNKASAVSWSQATSGSRPLFNATALNGYPCMDFDGTDDRFHDTSETAILDLFKDNNAFTVFYVAIHDTLDRAEWVFGCGNSGSTTQFKGFGQNTTSIGVWLANGNTSVGGAVNQESITSSNSDPNIFEWFGGGTDIALKLNNSGRDPETVAWSVGSITINRSSLGNRPRSTGTNGDIYFDGKLGELVVYNSQLSSTDRARVRNYLSAKWGISLPTTITNPTSISGAIAWFDMQDAASYTQAGTVTSITNKVSAVAWTEGSVPPAYSATGINGFPCMDFNGTTHRIISTEAAVFGALNNSVAYTLFYVGIHDVIDRTEAVFGTGNSGVATNQTRYWGQGTDGLGRWRSTTVNDAGTAINLASATGNHGDSDSNANIFCWSASTTGARLNLNNNGTNPAVGAQDPGTLTANRSSLGSRPDSAPDTFFDGKLGELIIYNRELTALERSTIAKYLGLKWSITINE